MSTPTRYQQWTQPLLIERVGITDPQEPDPDPSDPTDYASQDEGGAVQVGIDVGAVAFIQEASAHAGNAVGHVTATFGSTPVQGNVLIAVHAVRGWTTTATMVSSGWTHHPETPVRTDAFDGGRLNFWYKVAGASEATAVQVNSVDVKDLYIAEWSGLSGTPDAGDYGESSLGPSSTMTAGPASPTTSDGVLFAGFVQASRNASLALGGGYTERWDVNVDASGPSAVFGDLIVDPFTGTYSVSTTSDQSDTYGAILIPFTSAVGGVQWFPAPAANDGDTGTSDFSDSTPACLRVALDVSRLIYRMELDVGMETAGATVFELYGTNDATFAAPTLLGTLTFTATGSFTLDAEVLSWVPTASYQYYELQHVSGGGSDREFYEVRMFSAVSTVGVTDHPALSGRDTADQHPADAVSVTPFDTIAATDVQAALEEIFAEASGAITVEDGTTSVTPVDTIVFDGATVTDDTGGQVTVSVEGAVGGRTLLRQVYTRTGSDYTTSGTTMQNIDGTNLVFTLVLPQAARVRMLQVCQILGGATANQQIFMDAAVDGTRVGGTTDSEGLFAFRNANDTTQRRYNGSFSYTTDVLTAGSHTFAFMWAAASGTATIPFSGKPRWVVEEIPATTGSTAIATPTARTKYTAGDITCSANQVWAELNSALRATVPAVVGDVLEVSLSAVALGTEAVDLYLTAMSALSGTLTNDVATDAAKSDTTLGVSGWTILSGIADGRSGTLQYVVVAGDISGGNVTLTPCYRTSNNTDRILEATANSPIHFSVANLGQPGNASRMYLPTSTSPSLTQEGEVAYDSDDERVVVYDGQRARSVSDAGWVPFALPSPYPYGIGTTAFTITANGGTLLLPIIVPGHMLLESVIVGQAATTSAREWGWDLYIQDLNNGNSGENTLRRVAESNGNDAFTPSAASLRTLGATSAPVYLAPGIYWLAIQCTHATNAFSISHVATTSGFDLAQTKTTTNPNGATLDAVAATWTKQNDAYVVSLRGRVFGETTAF